MTFDHSNETLTYRVLPKYLNKHQIQIEKLYKGTARYHFPWINLFRTIETKQIEHQIIQCFWEAKWKWSTIEIIKC